MSVYDCDVMADGKGTAHMCWSMERDDTKQIRYLKVSAPGAVPAREYITLAEGQSWRLGSMSIDSAGNAVVTATWYRDDEDKIVLFRPEERKSSEVKTGADGAYDIGAVSSAAGVDVFWREDEALEDFYFMLKGKPMMPAGKLRVSRLCHWRAGSSPAQWKSIDELHFSEEFYDMVPITMRGGATSLLASKSPRSSLTVVSEVQEFILDDRGEVRDVVDTGYVAGDCPGLLWAGVSSEGDVMCVFDTIDWNRMRGEVLVGIKKGEAWSRPLSLATREGRSVNKAWRAAVTQVDGRNLLAVGWVRGDRGAINTHLLDTVSGEKSHCSVDLGESLMFSPLALAGDKEGLLHIVYMNTEGELRYSRVRLR